MLLEVTEKQISEVMPWLKYSLNEKSRSIEIPAKNEDVGGITIQDDGEELTVYVCNFTHCHFSNYDEDLSQDNKEKAIVEEVCEFLEQIFKDKIVMWGSHAKGGGYYELGTKPNSKKMFGGQHKEWVWSGALGGNS